MQTKKTFVKLFQFICVKKNKMKLSFNYSKRVSRDKLGKSVMEMTELSDCVNYKRKRKEP